LPDKVGLKAVLRFKIDLADGNLVRESLRMIVELLIKNLWQSKLEVLNYM